MSDCGRGRPRSRPKSPPRSKQIEQRLGELEEIGEDDFTDELMAEASQLEERRAEIDETIDGLAVYSNQDRARAGCIVTIGDDGEFCLHQGLVARAATRGVDPDELDASTGDDGDEVFTPASADEDGDPRPRPTPGAEQALRKECGFSQLLVDDLKAHRLQITRAHLAADFDVAFDLALYSLCGDLFRRIRYRTNPLDLRATEVHPRSSLNDLAGNSATAGWMRIKQRSNWTGSNYRPRRVSLRSRHCRPRRSGASSPGASPPPSNRSWPSRTAPTR